MGNAPTSLCDCGARIRWVEIDSRPVPLDIADREPGAGRIALNLNTGKAKAITLENLEGARVAVASGKGWHVYDRHHSSCSQVGRHRVPRAQGVLDV